MNLGDKFLSDFKDWYPFDRYIFKNPKPLSSVYDDILLTEIFRNLRTDKLIFTDCEEELIDILRGEDWEIGIMVTINGVEARLNFYDFNLELRKHIKNLFLEDFGKIEWESLYMEYDYPEEYEEVIIKLREQFNLITAKYGSCPILLDTNNELLKEFKKQCPEASIKGIPHAGTANTQEPS